MTSQKSPITLEAAAEAVFVQWRQGVNATVESVMKTLGTTHRQKVNDLMTQARIKAGEMIQQREAEALLEEDFPSDAFMAIRSWSEKVALKRFEEKEADLEAIKNQLNADRQSFEEEKNRLAENVVRLEEKARQLMAQNTALIDQAEQERAQSQAKTEMLERALLDCRERAGQAETRLEVTQSELGRSQLDLQAMQHQQEVQQKRIDDLTSMLSEQQTAHTKLAQEKEGLRARLVDAEQRHQQREADWLTERDQCLTAEVALQTRFEALQHQFSDVKAQHERSSASIKALQQSNHELKETNEQQRQQAVQLEQQLSRSEQRINEAKDIQKESWSRLIELERENAALQAEVAYLKGRESAE